MNGGAIVGLLGSNVVCICTYIFGADEGGSMFLRNVVIYLQVYIASQPRKYAGVRSPAEAKDFFSSLCVHTSSEAHSASCPMGTADPFPEDEARLRRDADHSFHVLPMSTMSVGYSSSPPCRLHGSNGTALFYFKSLHYDFRTHLSFYPVDAVN
jgi:hypothetical protein